jgi:hypothetical protein
MSRATVQNIYGVRKNVQNCLKRLGSPFGASWKTQDQGFSSGSG